MAKLFMLIATNGKNKSQEVKGAIMKEYKRLTEIINGTVHTIKKPKSNYIGTVYEEQAIINNEILNRLAELEDKIENGTLIELPCIMQNCYGDWRVHFYSDKYKDIDCYTFSTKAEAENAGCHLAELNVWAFNENAVNFYKSCGMTVQRMYMEYIL